MWKRMIVMAVLSVLLVACNTGKPEENPVERQDEDMNEQRDDIRLDEEMPDRNMDERQDRDGEDRSDPFKDDGTPNRDPLKENDSDMEKEK